MEARLERFGYFNAVQRYRYKAYSRRPWPRDKPPFSYFLTKERELREIAQREISLKAGIVTPLLGNEIEQGQPRSKDLQKELDILNRRYWFLEQRWWKLRSEFPRGPLIRAFELWRSHPRWYMHRSLVEDCARRGGCCGRGCGCCVDRELSATRTLGVGHCTVECGCCCESRGFELSLKEKEEQNQLFTLFVDKDGDSNPYAELIIMVSIWGLLDSSAESPFDVIVDVPRYAPRHEQHSMSAEPAENDDKIKPFPLIDEDGKSSSTVLTWFQENCRITST